MRLRKVKGASERLDDCPYVILNPEKDRGKFNKIFKNNHPIHIEIGTGKGNFVIEKAVRHPNINFIGIEKQDSVLVKALDKLEFKHLPNLKLIRMDAFNIDQVFDKEIDTIYLNFSDPWPKKKHANRRLTSPIFLRKYDAIFKKTNHIEMKTDNQKLFEYSIMTFTSDEYNIDKISLNMYEDLDLDNVQTEYERKFVSNGKPIYQIKVSKK